MKSPIVFVVCVMCLLLVMGCQKRPTELDLYKEFHKGKQGLTTTMIGVPGELLEQTPFTINLKADNLGAYTAEGLTVLSVEEDYLCFFDPATQQCLKDQTKEQADDKERAKVRSFVLQGRNRYMPTGESALVEYSLKTKSIEALSEQHKSRITATTCYTYTTEFIGEACFDPGKYSMKKTKPVCEMKPLNAKDQGAPLAITGVEVDLLSEGDIVKPQFIFTVENKGSGITVYPADKINELCSSSQVKFKETNALVLQELKLSNGLFYLYGRDDINTMICEPQLMRLKDGKDRIRCYQKSPKDSRFAIENTRPAFTVQLSATFTYGYMESKAQDMVIRKAMIR